MSDDNFYGVDQDYSTSASTAYAATSGRVGASPLASQGARVVAGYDANTLLAPFRLDAGGNLRTAPSNPSGGSVYLFNGQTPPVAAAQYGQQIMALQTLPTPVYMPLTLDPTGALQVHEKSKATSRFVQASVTGGPAGKSMLSIFNGSAATIVRIQQVNVQCPYLYQTGQAGLLGLSGTYNQSVAMYMEMRRITGHTKGASTATVGYALSDTADASQMDAGIVAYSNATVAGLAATAFHRADANSPSGLPWYLRGDANQKTLNLRPGEGVSIQTVTNTASITFELEAVVTVAAG